MAERRLIKFYLLPAVALTNVPAAYLKSRRLEHWSLTYSETRTLDGDTVLYFRFSESRSEYVARRDGDQIAIYKVME